MTKVLVIDDDRAAWGAVRRALQGLDIEVVATPEVEDGLRLVAESDVVLVGESAREPPPIEATRAIHKIDPQIPVIIIAADGTSETAIEAIKQGACDYLLKPLDLPRLQAAVSQAIKAHRCGKSFRDHAAGEAPEFAGGIVGRSAPMQEVFKAIGRAAPQNVTILIQGESGTGKELVARAIHHHSSRARRTFLAVNCAAIPEQLLESELFGHEKGSFTGADERRIGKFEHCSGGTIFLDEIGDMPASLQAKILRVLQEQRFERVGGSQSIETDVRIIAATNRDLRRLVAQGSFREDLFYRLDGFTIFLPPLRDREEDLLILLDHCLQRLGKELGKPARAITPEAVDLLKGYSWPGNVRELEAVVRQALLQAPGSVVLPEFLPEAIRGADSESAGDGRQLGDGELQRLVEKSLRNHSGRIYSDATELLDRYILTRVLRETRGNQSQAARLLGITRGCLRSRIRKLHISLGAKITHELAGDVSARR
jgi:two-component system nitrogen regulation response regulator GlnG